MIYIEENSQFLRIPRTGTLNRNNNDSYYTKGEIDAMLSVIDGRLDDAEDTEAALELEKTPYEQVFVPTQIDLSSISLLNYYIKDDGTYNTSTNDKHIIIPALPGQIYRVQGASDYNGAYAFTTTTTATAGGQAHYVPGTSKVVIPAGETMIFVCPAGTAYVYLRAGNTSTGTGTERLPQLVERMDSRIVVTPVYNSNTSVATISQVGQADVTIVPSQTMRPYIRFIGNGYYFTTGINYSQCLGIVGGHTYRFHIIDTNPDMTGVTGGYRYETVFLKADGTTDIQNRVNWNSNLKDYYDATAPADAVSVYIGGRCAAGLEFGAWVEDLGDLSQGGDILVLNPETEWIPKMMAAKKRYYTSGNNSLPQPVVLAQFTDIHGNWTNAERFLKFCKKYSSYIDLLVQSGDLVTQYYTNSIAGYTSLDGVDKIINVIGNHDTYHSGGTWQQHAGLDAYNKFIAPWVDGWGVTQPANAATNGYCYFYKDFTDQALRIIFVDIMAYAATEDAWLASTLTDALSNSYAVLIVTHYAGARQYSEYTDPTYDKVDCNWSTLYSTGTTSTQLYAYNHDAYLMNQTVQNFIDAGGEFCGYIQGHYHREFFAKVYGFNDQLVFAAGAEISGEVSDYNHVVGTKDQDEFQIVSVNTYTKTVTVYKVGASIDLYGRIKNSISVKYTTGEIISDN